MADVIKQKCRFSHPLRRTFYEGDIPVDMTFKQIEEKLIEEGFIDSKVGGYQFIYEDHMCKLAAPLSDYVPEGVECMEIRIHGLLIVLT